MGINDRFHNRQAKTAAAGGPGARSFNTEKWQEDIFLMLFGNPRPLVANGNQDGISRCIQTDISTVTVFQRILDQVGEGTF